MTGWCGGGGGGSNGGRRGKDGKYLFYREVGVKNDDKRSIEGG